MNLGTPRTAVFFGGVVPASSREEELAEYVGASLARHGYDLLHGGYNGLMEAAARGATKEGSLIQAATLSGKHELWGSFNDYVEEPTFLPSVGTRLDFFLDRADLVVAMAGGVGTLHELTTAIYYAGNIRAIPVVVTGSSALHMLAYLRGRGWLVETPTRPLGFLREARTASQFTEHLSGILTTQEEV